MAYLKIVADDGDTVAIECSDDDLFQYLDLKALAYHHNLSSDALYRRLSRKMPLTLALKTEQRQYNKN
ncbi:hypothetical protein [Pantoea agglomerans]|uniref:hypothetical protein n=1 Tax=Enterobacter agglomerans TaxID=549 RepID=UPI00384EBC3C